MPRRVCSATNCIFDPNCKKSKLARQEIVDTAVAHSAANIAEVKKHVAM